MSEKLLKQTKKFSDTRMPSERLQEQILSAREERVEVAVPRQRDSTMQRLERVLGPLGILLAGFSMAGCGNAENADQPAGIHDKRTAGEDIGTNSSALTVSGPRFLGADCGGTTSLQQNNNGNWIVYCNSDGGGGKIITNKIDIGKDPLKDPVSKTTLPLINIFGVAGSANWYQKINDGTQDRAFALSGGGSLLEQKLLNDYTEWLMRLAQYTTDPEIWITQKVPGKNQFTLGTCPKSGPQTNNIYTLDLPPYSPPTTWDNLKKPLSPSAPAVIKSPLGVSCLDTNCQSVWFINQDCKARPIPSPTFHFFEVSGGKWVPKIPPITLPTTTWFSIENVPNSNDKVLVGTGTNPTTGKDDLWVIKASLPAANEVPNSEKPMEKAGEIVIPVEPVQEKQADGGVQPELIKEAVVDLSDAGSPVDQGNPVDQVPDQQNQDANQRDSSPSEPNPEPKPEPKTEPSMEKTAEPTQEKPVQKEPITEKNPADAGPDTPPDQGNPPEKKDPDITKPDQNTVPDGLPPKPAKEFFCGKRTAGTVNCTETIKQSCKAETMVLEGDGYCFHLAPDENSIDGALLQISGKIMIQGDSIPYSISGLLKVTTNGTKRNLGAGEDKKFQGITYGTVTGVKRDVQPDGTANLTLTFEDGTKVVWKALVSYSYQKKGETINVVDEPIEILVLDATNKEVTISEKQLANDARELALARIEPDLPPKGCACDANDQKPNGNAALVAIMLLFAGTWRKLRGPLSRVFGGRKEKE